MASVPATDEDLFRYGWRYVQKSRSNGTEQLIQVPLTPEDVLHPQEEDCIPESLIQEKERRYLKDVFDLQLRNDDTALVLSDCLVDLGVTGIKPVSPDITVLFGVRQPLKRDWGTFRMERHGGRLALIIEITSPKTRKNDRGIKMTYYQRAQVPHYIIVDRDGYEGVPTLLGYRLAKKGYVPMRADKHGRLFLEAVNVWLAVRDDRVACHDAKTGKELGDYTEVSEALNTATKARTQAQRARTKAEQRATEAESRVAELEAELRRLRGER